MSVGTTVFGIGEQSINFENDLPVISFVNNGVDPTLASNRLASGSTFSNNYMKSDVQQLQFNASYEVDRDIIDSVDFGAGWLENKFRQESGFIQTDSWGGLGTPDDIPDDFFEWVTLPDKFSGVSGADDPDMLQGLYRFDFEQMVDLLESQFGICSSPWVGSTSDNPGTCLANRPNSQDLQEKTFSAYMQFNTSFNLFGTMPANLTAGARYERTEVKAPAVIQVPSGTSWPGGNEFFLTFDGTTEVTEFDGDYSKFLPSVDFDVDVTDEIKFRAAYSKTMARQRYNELQPARTLDSLFRADAGTGSQGNPGLEPFTSKNFDLSAEWYYDDDSYVSVGWFKKDINGFVGSDVYTDNFYGLTHPGLGPVAAEARAALGSNATGTDVVNWYLANYPQLVQGGAVIGTANDPLVPFDISFPVVSDRTDGFDGWEFAVQHTFGESGFGFIANYTIANTDLEYDNTQPFRVLQIALPGVSDSANLVGFYDKNGLQARVAWNWRDEFLSGSGRNPFYIEAYEQIDANISYEIRDGLTIFAEGIDITNTDRRGFRRHENNVFFMNPQKGRYAVGARYKF